MGKPRELPSCECCAQGGQMTRVRVVSRSEPDAPPRTITLCTARCLYNSNAAWRWRWRPVEPLVRPDAEHW